MSTTLHAEAARRAFDTLLNNAQPRSVMLRTPAPAVAGDAHEQLGLVAPLFQDTELAPAVLRKNTAKNTATQHTEHELLVSATAISILTGSTDFAAANSLFATAFGVLIDNTLLTITAITEITAGSIACGYKLALREPATTV